MLSMIGWFLLLVGGWLGGLAALTLAGWGLSRSVCATIKASARDISVPEHLLRAAHAIVMRIAAWVYYLSMPLAALAVTIPFVVMLAGEIIHGHLSLHHMEAFGTLVIFTWVMTLWALTAGANSVGALPRGTAFEVLKLDDHPKLRALLNDVAVSTGARPVDEVLLHTDARIEAFSLGGLAKHLVGSPGRLVVVIGLGLIDAVTVGELRVLIAIELARLHDRSVAGGAYSLQLRGALSRAISSLLSSPASRWNFGYQFLRAFRWAFGLVSDGAARWQQRAADDRAIESFGPALFCKAIAHTPDATNGRTQRARAMGLLRAKSKPSDDEPASSLLENRAAIERAIAPFSRAAADDGHDEASNKPSKPSLTDPW
jgi:hypothetical protein